MLNNKKTSNESVQFVEIEGQSFIKLLVPGNKDTYIETLRSLVGLISATDQNDMREGDMGLVCHLLESMLPSFTQLK